MRRPLTRRYFQEHKVVHSCMLSLLRRFASKKRQSQSSKIIHNKLSITHLPLQRVFTERGLKLTSGGSDNHLVLIDLRPSHPDLTGKQAQFALESANITTNRNSVPGDTRSPFQTSGLRIGSPAVTTRGMQQSEMETISNTICDILDAHEDEKVIAQAKETMIALCKRFPLPY